MALTFTRYVALHRRVRTAHGAPRVLRTFLQSRLNETRVLSARRTPTHRVRLGLVKEEVLHAVEDVGVQVLVRPPVQVGRLIQLGRRADGPGRLEGGERGDAMDAFRWRAARDLAEKLLPVGGPCLVVPPGGQELVVGRVAAAEVEQPLPQLRARAEEAVELVPGVGVRVGGWG